MGTYARFYALKQNECCGLINDAEHSLFLTSIIVAQSFWSTLGQDLQIMIKDAAFDAARMERGESLEDVEIVKEKCAQGQVEIVTLPEHERDCFKNATAYLYDKFDTMFSEGLIDQIRAS